MSVNRTLSSTAFIGTVAILLIIFLLCCCICAPNIQAALSLVRYMCRCATRQRRAQWTPRQREDVTPRGARVRENAPTTDEEGGATERSFTRVLSPSTSEGEDTRSRSPIMRPSRALRRARAGYNEAAALLPNLSCLLSRSPERPPTEILVALEPDPLDGTYGVPNPYYQGLSPNDHALGHPDEEQDRRREVANRKRRAEQGERDELLPPLVQHQPDAAVRGCRESQAVADLQSRIRRGARGGRTSGRGGGRTHTETSFCTEATEAKPEAQAKGGRNSSEQWRTTDSSQ